MQSTPNNAMKGLHSTFLIVTFVQVMCFTIVSHKPKKEIINLVIYSPINRENIEPHNLEVPGSSPGWSTRKQSVNCTKSSS